MTIQMVSNPHAGGAGGHFASGGRVYTQGLTPFNSFGQIPWWNWYGNYPWWWGGNWPGYYPSTSYIATPIYAPVAPAPAAVAPNQPCCYDGSTQTLSCPGTSMHGAPASVKQRGTWQGRTIVLVTSPVFNEDRWLWTC